MANLNWSLLNWQIDVWQDKHRFKVIAAGRRTGKSNLSIKKIIAAGLEAPAGSAVLYVGPTQSQVRQIAWDAILDQGREVIKSAHVNSMDVTLLNGVKIHLRSAENPDTLRGLKLHFAVIDEAAFIKDDNLWSRIIRPALSDLKGGAWFISSPSGRNWFYDLYKLGLSEEDPDWKSWHKTTFDNPTIDPKEVEAAKKTLSSFSFKQEFLASFDNAGQDVFKEAWLKTAPEPQYGSYVIAIDLAGFEEVGKNPNATKARLDESAISIVKVLDNGDWWVKKIEHGRWDIRTTASKILLAVREYQPVAVGIEKGALKNAVAPYLNDLMRKNNVYAHIHDLTHGNRRKQDRVVWSLQGRFEHGRISFNEDEEWTEAWDQICMFPTAGVHDDLVDSLSYCDQLAMTSYNTDYEEDEHEVLDIVSGY
jgi:phage terminase large subunit-like protein